MKNAKVNASLAYDKAAGFVAVMRPPSGEGLKPYIAAAARALGGRSDADLGRSMGVPASTIASWKRRGSIPSPHYEWFTTALAEKILEARSKAYADDNFAMTAVLSLMAKTGNNPWNLDDGTAILASADAVRELVPLAGFLYESRPDLWANKPVAETVEGLSDLLEGSLHTDVRLWRGGLPRQRGW